MLSRVVLTSGLRRGLAVDVVSKRTLYPTNYRHLVGPPRERVAFAEKVFWGLFMFVGVMATPAYIMVNLDHYKGKAK